MSKSRGKSEPGPVQTAAREKPAQPPQQSESAAISSPFHWCVAMAAAVATGVYLLIFFGQDLLLQADRSYPRFLVFTNLLTPDDLAKDWVEGNWRNFMVLDRWKIVLCAIGLLFYLSFLFSTVLMRWRFDLTRLEMVIFAQAIGLQLMSLLILSFGLLIGFRSSFILLIFFPLIIFLVKTLRFSRERQIERDANNDDSDSPFHPGARPNDARDRRL